MEKDIYRKKQLLELLVNNPHWITTQALTKQLLCSEKTIRKDIQTLSSILPTGWNIQVQKGKGVQLCKTADSSLSEVLSILTKSTLQSKFIEMLFFNKVSSVTQLSQELFIQPASLAQCIKNLNRDLSAYGLEVSKRPIKLKGQELQIRIYYFQFFRRNHDPQTWLFHAFSLDRLNQYLEEIENMLQIDFSVATKQECLYWLAITFHRIQKGHVIIETNPLDYVIKETYFFEQLTNLFNKIETIQKLTLCEKERIFLTTIILSCQFTYRDALRTKRKKLKRFYEEDLPGGHYLSDLLNRCQKQIGVNLCKHEQLLFLLIEYFQKQIVFLSLPPIFQRPNNEIEKYVKEFHTELFYKVEKIYKSWAEKHSFYSHNEEIVTTLVLFMQTSRALMYENKVKILIMSKYGIPWEYYISVQLQERFANMIQVVETYSEKITQEIIDRLQVQIIIVDVPNTLVAPIIISLDAIPTERDWETIKKSILYFKS
ncbi:helix-turn-helix domain-containing protein [Bacillus wiedmannii]|uniref:helix-turn-helix domain-containing protein n=1 Tax=Bacillus wiedmannii TaxID=1890302 RepID=UPI001485B4F9|nr:helix-turn-helix domain-containing protein [Bacillus wiedmannii]